MKTLAKILGTFVLSFLAISVRGQSSTDFSGHWREETNTGTQRRLDVEQNGRRLLVTTIVANSQGTRKLKVKYEIGGPEVTYTGLDGDQFRSSVHQDGSALVFDITESERGREIPQTTIWTLSPDRNALQMDRHTTQLGNTTHSSTTYVRQNVH